MTRRATFGPNNWLQTALTTLALCSAIALIGCGGGGGGGGNPGGGGGGAGVCGSVAGSTTPVICGTVVVDGTSTGIAGATVSLRNAAGTTLSTTSTDGSGGYKFNTVPAGAVLFQVDPPTTGFHTRTSRFGGSVYLYYINDQANAGPCLPALGAGVLGDKKLGNVGLFPDANPPPPAFGCPR